MHFFNLFPLTTHLAFYVFHPVLCPQPHYQKLGGKQAKSPCRNTSFNASIKMNQALTVTDLALKLFHLSKPLPLRFLSFSFVFNHCQLVKYAVYEFVFFRFFQANPRKLVIFFGL
jgi:hypothetical protein